MSLRAMTWVWELDLPTSTKMVALALADHVNEDGVCWPKIASLSKRTGLGPRAVQKHLSTLEDLGILVRAPRYDDRGVQVSSLLRMSVPRCSWGEGEPACTPPGEGEPTFTPRGEPPCTLEGEPGFTPSRTLSREPSVEPPLSFGQRASSAAVRRGAACSTRSGPPPPEQTVYPAEFEEFWSEYPRKVHKGDALRAWKSTAKIRPPLEQLLAALRRCRNSEQWRDEGGRFVPHPGRWLRAHGWADEAGGNGRVSGSQRVADLLRLRGEQR